MCPSCLSRKRIYSPEERAEHTFNVIAPKHNRKQIDIICKLFPVVNFVGRQKNQEHGQERKGVWMTVTRRSFLSPVPQI